MSIKQPTLALARPFLAALLALSCNVSAGAGTTTTEEGTAPAAAPHVVAPPVKLDQRTADLESTGLPSSEMVAKTNALAARLGSAIGQDQGVRVAFVSCEQAPCSARLSGSSLEALQQAIGDVERDQQGQIAVTTRERLDPYMGRSFEADVTFAEATAP